jgi:hypothetical protein
MTARQRRQYWIRQQNKQKRIIARYTAKFFNALKADTDGYLQAYEQGGDRAALRYANSLLISPKVSDTMDALYREVGSRYARAAYDESIKQKAFETLLDWFNEIMNYIGTDFYNKGVLRITETTRNILIQITDKAIVEGWGYLETAKYFREVIPKINRNRAEMIARTETGKAIHAGTYVGADKSPFEKQKEWISALDARVRRNPTNDPRKADHMRLDGMIVNFDEKFIDSTNNVSMLHPHDPSAPASEVINCRCTFNTVNKRDANGRLIRKPSTINNPALVNQ